MITVSAGAGFQSGPQTWATHATDGVSLPLSVLLDVTSPFDNIAQVISGAERVTNGQRQEIVASRATADQLRDVLLAVWLSNHNKLKIQIRTSYIVTTAQAIVEQDRCSQSIFQKRTNPDGAGGRKGHFGRPL